MKLILLLFPILFSPHLFGQIVTSITIFQSNLLELSEAFEKRDYQTIHKLLHHKQVSEETIKREVELAIKDSLLPLNVIKLILKN